MTEFWTIERIDRLFVMVREGYSFSQIGTEIGCTRNAAIGKYNRTRVSRGIHTRVPRPKIISLVREDKISAELVRNTTPKRVYTRKQRAPQVSGQGVGFLLPAIVPPKPEVISTGISIVEVTGCRYPVTDDPLLVGGQSFCNEALDGHRMYCAHHARIVYTKAPKPQGGMRHHRVIPTSLLRAGGY